jgi:hypothetical protein
MKWNEKTDEQYEASATIITGGDNENELSLSEDDLSLIEYLISHAIADLTYDEGGQELIEGELALDNLGDQGLEHLKKLRDDLVDLGDFDCSPIHIYETDMARLETGRINAVELIESVKLRQKRIKQTDG